MNAKTTPRKARSIALLRKWPSTNRRRQLQEFLQDIGHTPTKCKFFLFYCYLYFFGGRVECPVDSRCVFKQPPDSSLESSSSIGPLAKLQIRSSLHPSKTHQPPKRAPQTLENTSHPQNLTPSQTLNTLNPHWPLRKKLTNKADLEHPCRVIFVARCKNQKCVALRETKNRRSHFNGPGFNGVSLGFPALLFFPASKFATCA